MIKNYIFQLYGQGFLNDKYIDSGLISKEEAINLWKDNYEYCVRRINSGELVQMCIFKDCEDEKDFEKILCEIDSRDDVYIECGTIVKKTKEYIYFTPR